MLDDDDVSDVCEGVCDAVVESGNGWVMLVGLAIVIVVLLIALSNHAECAEKVCAPESRPQLISHDCLCVKHLE